MIRKLAAYVILGINTEGKKEVLSITVGDNESSKYWLSVLNELKRKLDWLLDRVTEKWTMSIRNWGRVYGELSIMYEGRLPE